MVKLNVPAIATDLFSFACWAFVMSTTLLLVREKDERIMRNLGDEVQRTG